MRVLILGGTGMLGSMVARMTPDDWEIRATARVPAPYPYELSNLRWERLAVGAPGWEDDLRSLAGQADCTINCLGATKPLMLEPAARAANSRVAHVLQEAGHRAIHASTDCVFSGKDGAPYLESSPHDAGDAYACTKSTGEAGPPVTVFRCSIIGPECREPARHLLGKVLEGQVSVGWSDHVWNGLTTLAWARLACAAAEMGWEQLPPVLHLVPADAVTKCDLVRTMLSSFGVQRDVAAVPSRMPMDMRMATEHPDVLADLWRRAGYPEAPAVGQMVEELASFCRDERWPCSSNGWRCWQR